MPARMKFPTKARVLPLGCDQVFESDLNAVLRSEGCEALAALDYEEALELVYAGNVDILVMDFDIYSREYSRHTSNLSSVSRGWRTLVLAGSLEQLTLAREAGADCALMKPLEPEQVRDVISNLLIGVRSYAAAEDWLLKAPSFVDAKPRRREGGINE